MIRRTTSEPFHIKSFLAQNAVWESQQIEVFSVEVPVKGPLRYTL